MMTKSTQHLSLLRALSAAYCLPMAQTARAVDSAETNLLRFYRENPDVYANCTDEQKDAAYSYSHRHTA